MLDTEFTDFFDLELISIGLVTEAGQEFYAERTDFDRSKCSPFVREAVLPMLGQDQSRCFDRETLRVNLIAWLSQFEEQAPVYVGFDYSTDWDLLWDAVEGPIPAWIRPLLIAQQIDQLKCEEYFTRPGVRRHHALDDAKANLYGYSEPDA